MTNLHHTDIAFGAAALSAVFNAPLGQLDAAIETEDARIDALILSPGISPSEVVDARAGIHLGAGITPVLRDTVGWAAGGVFNALAYGALGNGIADDRAAIQAALDAANAAGGGVVLLPPGTYLVGEVAHPDDAAWHACLVIYRHTTLRGAGVDATAIKRAANGAGANSAVIWNRKIGVTLDYDTDIVIRDLTIDGNGANQAIGAQLGIGFMRARHTLCQAVRVKNVRGTTSSGAGESFGFEFSLSAEGTYIDCEALCDAGSSSSGFSANSSMMVRYAQCVAHGMTVASGFTHNGCRHMQHVNCHGYANYHAGFNSESSSDVTYLDCISGGLALAAPGFSAGTDLGALYGIVVNLSTHVLIAGVICRYNNVGIQVLGTGVGVAISNTDVSDSDTGIAIDATAGAGLRLKNVVALNCSLAQVGHPTLGAINLDTPEGAVVATSGVAVPNPFPFACAVIVSGGTGVGILLNGAATGLSSGTFVVGKGCSITVSWATSITVFTWIPLV